MTVVSPRIVGRVSAPSRVTLRRIRWHHPEWWLLTAALMAWLAIARASHPSSHQMSVDPATMLLMVVAMMLPLSLPNARHVGLSSLWHRRQRAIAWFAAGYLVVALLTELVMVRSWMLLDPIIGSTAALILAVVAATVWEVSPIKQRLLRRCEYTMPLAPSGWRAGRDCVRYGARIGLTCVAMCWALMLVCVTAPHAGVVMLAIFGLQVGRRMEWHLLLPSTS
ncbi:MAG: DUF2182 domain-containing protein [Gemmatimonadota bacterium]|nr:DUF2182 domain-containing protein [Gemmatimonadota bacterium]